MQDDSRFKYSYKETRRENIGLRVHNSGMEQCSPSYQWGPGLRDHYLLHYVSRGKGTYHCIGKEWEIVPDSLFLSFPDTIISYKADAAEPWEYSWVGFQGIDARRLLEQTAFTKEKPVLHTTGADARLEQLLVDIYEARGATPSHDAAMTGRLYLLWEYLIENFPASCGNRTQSHIYFEQAVRYLSQSLEKEMTVQEIAAFVGLSRSQLYRVFIAECGMPPVDFLCYFRVSRAAELLENGQLTVAQVAASVGYSDPLYFSRVFKRIKGISPRTYRQCAK